MNVAKRTPDGYVCPTCEKLNKYQLIKGTFPIYFLVGTGSAKYRVTCIYCDGDFLVEREKRLYRLERESWLRLAEDEQEKHKKIDVQDVLESLQLKKIAEEIEIIDDSPDNVPEDNPDNRQGKRLEKGSNKLKNS